jgi:Undecaprenyl-phosphate glucose phosphotransferase
MLDETSDEALFSYNSLILDGSIGLKVRNRLPNIPASAFVALCVILDSGIVAFLALMLAQYFGSHGLLLGDVATIGAPVVAVLLIFAQLNFYKIELVADFVRLSRTFVHEFLILILALAFAEAAILLYVPLANGMSGHFYLKWDASFAVACWYATVLALVLIGRYGISKLFKLCVHTGLVVRKVVVVGATSAAEDFINCMHNARLGVRVVAVFEGEGPMGAIASIAGIPVRGGIKDLLMYSKRNEIDTVVLTLPLHEVERTKFLVQRLSVLPLRTRILPGHLTTKLPDSWYAPAGELPGVQLLRVTDLPIERSGLLIKGLFDRLSAGAALLLFLPIMLACAVIIKTTSPGPVFFKQPRIGLGNRTFQMYKFRSMNVHDGSDKSLTARNDSRIFAFGRVMRKLSLDELPQLLNVMRGDMSMVGPRPHMPEAAVARVLYHNVVADYAARHRVKPGITGWAQVNGWRGPTETFEQLENRVRHDLYYIENWSFLLDLSILLRTVLVGFFGKNAF